MAAGACGVLIVCFIRFFYYTAAKITRNLLLSRVDGLFFTWNASLLFIFNDDSLISFQVKGSLVADFTNEMERLT